ncbi:YDC1 [Symbiodinium sp. CCMP2592]|nr:YDC1 [Symbiodinium sp. CCMP2592]
MAKRLPQASSARCTPRKLSPGTWPPPIEQHGYMWPTCSAPRGPRIMNPASTRVAWSIPGHPDRMPQPRQPAWVKSLAGRPLERPLTDGGIRTPRISRQRKLRPRLNANSLLMQSDLYKTRASSSPGGGGPSRAHCTVHEPPEMQPEATSCSSTRPASAMSPMREADETAQIAATLALHVHELHERQASLVTCSEAPVEEESKPRPCALAESAAAYRERRRQADAVAELELQELIKKTAVRTEEQEASGDKGGDPPVLEGPQTIAEVYALCKQLSEAFLLPISEVKACYEDFRSLDIDGNFALSAEEFELAVSDESVM